jgi:hypothetical protein
MPRLNPIRWQLHVRHFFAGVLFLASASAAWAQTTTCRGLDCTVEGNGMSRKLSRDEALTHLRAGIISEINSLNCSYAIDQKACQTLKNQLLRQFLE